MSRSHSRVSDFDFIVVGAGSAGCVLANRLSADVNTRVLLIEAGGEDRNPWIHIPVGYFKTMGNPGTDWCFQTANDPGLNGRSIKWPRGRVLGGSSSINGLLYVRGQAQDYDDWAAAGCTGWSWNEVLPLFIKSEQWADTAHPDRGQHGELKVETSRLRREITDRWHAAALEAGYPENPDYNAGDQHGVAPFQMTVHKGLRCSSAKAFLKPIRQRPNLTVYTHRTVAQLCFEDRRCTGVRLHEGDQILHAKAEVILCAGAIGSPMILMQSGIGAGDELQQANIDLLVDLPGVGKNLQDHLQARPVFSCSTSTINTETRSLVRRAGMALEFLIKRSGPMTMAASLGTGFLSTPLSPDRPDIQFHVQPWSADSPERGPHRFSAFTASVLQLRPESAGCIKLNTDDPTGQPKIHPNYLATELDQQTIVAGIRVARHIARQAPLQAVNATEHGPLADIDDTDEAALLDWARSNSTTIYHPTGTCKMGVDRAAVVDPELRVHGTEGLRVADCSIMPQIVSGNTNAPAIMIGEKCAELILRK